MGKNLPLYVIGLTGNTGSGKTTVANYLQSLGARIIDADQVAREVVRPGEPALEKIAASFGNQIINKDGTLNRKRLGVIVFQDKTALSRLNSIIHPAILKNIMGKLDSLKNKINKNSRRIVVIDAPLLIETNLHSIVDQLWVVAADKNVRLQRIISRDNLTLKEAVQRISSQLSQEEKIKLADRVIYNDGTPENTYLQVKKYWQEIVTNLSGDESYC